MLFAVVAITAQTTISISGNTVTFTTKFPTDGFSSTPVYLYSWVEATDNTQGVFKEVLGGWPGTLMNGPDGSGNYTLSVDLAAFYDAGTTVNTMKFIYNTGAGTQTADLTSTANATGWSAVTIQTMGISDVNGLAKKSVVAEGKLYTAKKGNVTVQILDFSGRIVKTISANATSGAIDLNLAEKGLFLVKVSDATSSEVIKFKN